MYRYNPYAICHRMLRHCGSQLAALYLPVLLCVNHSSMSSLERFVLLLSLTSVAAVRTVVDGMTRPMGDPPARPSVAEAFEGKGYVKIKMAMTGMPMAFNMPSPWLPMRLWYSLPTNRMRMDELGMSGERMSTLIERHDEEPPMKYKIDFTGQRPSCTLGILGNDVEFLGTAIPKKQLKVSFFPRAPSSV